MIALGREVYEAVLADPDSLAAIDDLIERTLSVRALRSAAAAGCPSPRARSAGARCQRAPRSRGRWRRGADRRRGS
ncbi:MAG: DUF4240 domain-containing protein [Deltaproteobacteria bacterium]|nr:DUF4240 domain-containing protein [Deltaproteobacteria bacterium]